MKRTQDDTRARNGKRCQRRYAERVPDLKTVEIERLLARKRTHLHLTAEDVWTQQRVGNKD